MPRPPASQPTEVELRILTISWQAGPCSAREVHNGLAEDKQTNYSTTVKMLAVMFDKGLVTRDESTYPLKFTAAISQDRTRQSVLADMIRKLYDGSAKSLVMQALTSQKSSKEDLDEIRDLIAQLDAKQAKKKEEQTKKHR